LGVIKKKKTACDVDQPFMVNLVTVLGKCQLRRNNDVVEAFQEGPFFEKNVLIGLRGKLR